MTPSTAGVRDEPFDATELVRVCLASASTDGDCVVAEGISTDGVTLASALPVAVGCALVGVAVARILVVAGFVGVFPIELAGAGALLTDLLLEAIVGFGLADAAGLAVAKVTATKASWLRFEDPCAAIVISLQAPGAVQLCPLIDGLICRLVAKLPVGLSDTCPGPAPPLCTQRASAQLSALAQYCGTIRHQARYTPSPTVA